ncbi:MAG: hypothetical protein JWQ24_1504 [Tardiphaga sp.]|nr:hypothetical protein [Tardiphaga sp.]MDB5617266.1 hypothetical protein [Tardiphaga sp.]
MAFDGVNLSPLFEMLSDKVADATAHPGELMDLSVIAQLLNLKQQGLSIQRKILARHRLFRSPCYTRRPDLRVLALAASIDIGGNTPIEFLLEGSAIELTTLYVVPGTELPSPLPMHDVAIVIASDSEDCRAALAEIDRIAMTWPKPLLNRPHLVMQLDRDKLYRLLVNIDGLTMPITICASRSDLTEAMRDQRSLTDPPSEMSFPLIIRPRGSHAGKGLSKIDGPDGLHDYLSKRPEEEFFVSQFVDYADDYGIFRKYRIVAVDGRFFACHMAIADQWDIWYLNAGMLFDSGKRAEEKSFMETFNTAFASRHGRALSMMLERIGLDYFTVDCAEDRNGNLLIFEVDNTAVVHNMDPADIYPYKGPQMRAIFSAFSAMLVRAAALPTSNHGGEGRPRQR